jgi:hypothetical protein
MKYIVIVGILLIYSITQAQSSRSMPWAWDYGFSLGASNYLGDIGGKEQTRRDFVADMKFAKTRWNIGGFARYKVHDRLSIKLALDYLRIEGDDKLSNNPGRNARNLNFRNDMFDLAATGQVKIYEDNDVGNTYRNKVGFRAYFFAGLGMFYTNPKAYVDGSYVKLRPLQTEGVSYSPIGINIPAGVGFYFTFRKKHRIGYELNYRTTFTDYLDDISGTYADPTGMSTDAAALSNRTNELSNIDPAFAKNFGYNSEQKVGNKRGDPTHKDSYMTMSVSYSYVIRGKSSFYKGRYGNNFFNKLKRSKTKVIRSKF